jgi:hypothetical protein
MRRKQSSVGVYQINFWLCKLKLRAQERKTANSCVSFIQPGLQLVRLLRVITVFYACFSHCYCMAAADENMQIRLLILLNIQNVSSYDEHSTNF